MINNITIQEQAIGKLNQYWGHTTFRPLQLDVVTHIVEQNDAIVLFPTGGGKSLCFQIPALLASGLSLVLTPLIALMDDQVANLKEKGIEAESIHSGKTKYEVDRILDNCQFGSTKLLYLSPEKFNSEYFFPRLERLNVSIIAIDEAHCISQWGFDFRPSYLEIEKTAYHFPNATLVALTATADKRVLADIEKYAGLKAPKIFRKSFKRKNISLSVIDTENKYEALKFVLNKEGVGLAIVYVRSRKATENITSILKNSGIAAQFYHAGMSLKQRKKVLDEFRNDKIRVVCATNAFGMGLDKSNIDMVIHIDVPPSIEEYVQEYGRAGRAGQASQGIIFVNDGDKNFALKKLYEKYPLPEVFKLLYADLHKYYNIATGDGEEAVRDFNIFKFNEYTELSLKNVHHGLRILEKNGYITCFEQVGQKTKVKIGVPIRSIRENDLPQKEQEVLLALVRMYEGIVENSCQIDLFQLSQFVDESQNDTEEVLKRLSKKNYIGFYKSDPGSKLLFHHNRLPSRTFTIDLKAYEAEKKISENKVKQMLDYLESDDCRTKFILEYFDEGETPPCDNCDNCGTDNPFTVDLHRLRYIQDSFEEGML